MNKRTFLKLISATAASQGLSSAATQGKLMNWAGNFEYSTDQLYEARTLDKVRETVKAHKKLKALGTKHCFNKIADSRDGLLLTKSMDESIALDAASKSVTVNAGITYGRLAVELESKGFALHNLASLPHISVGGACSTGTHGSGEKNGNLATAASALELVTANGEVLHLSRAKDAETFRGAVVGLGALGIITKVTLDVQPTFSMRQYVYENMPFDQMRDHFDDIEASGYSVSLFTDWQKRRVNEVWVKARAGDPGYDGPAELFGARRATRNLHPIAELSAENCTEQLGVPGPWYERLPHFRMGFTPSAGKELQTEYFVPRKHAIEAILAVERLHEQIGPHLMITEIRSIAADDLWMSMAYRQPSIAIHFTWKQDWPAVKLLLPQIERELAPFNPRPHWGKLFTMTPLKLSAAYERLPDFLALCQRLDPQGKFRNEFLNTNVFSHGS
jgi:xylitol oxidase